MERDSNYEAFLKDPRYKLWGGLEKRLRGFLYEIGIPPPSDSERARFQDMQLGITDPPPTEEVGLCQLVVAFDVVKDLQSQDPGARETALAILEGKRKLSVGDLAFRTDLVIGGKVQRLLEEYKAKRDKK